MELTRSQMLNDRIIARIFNLSVDVSPEELHLACAIALERAMQRVKWSRAHGTRDQRRELRRVYEEIDRMLLGGRLHSCACEARMYRLKDW